MLSRGRKPGFGIQVSALLFCRAPACHLQASVQRPDSLPALLGSLSLSAGIWAPASLSWAWLLPPPSSRTLSGSQRAAAVLPAPTQLLEKGFLPWQGTDPILGAPGLFIQGCSLSLFLPRLCRETPGPGAPTPPPGWISHSTRICCRAPLLRKKPESLRL